MYELTLTYIHTACIYVCSQFDVADAVAHTAVSVSSETAQQAA